MPYYRTCPRCGANLDPGERCSDCRAEAEKDAHPPTKHCERLYNQQLPKQTVSPIVYCKGVQVKRFGEI